MSSMRKWPCSSVRQKRETPLLLRARRPTLAFLRASPVSRRTTLPATVAVSLLGVGEVVGDCAQRRGNVDEVRRRHKMDSDLMYAFEPTACGPIITQNRGVQKMGCGVSEGRITGRP